MNAWTSDEASVSKGGSSSEWLQGNRVQEFGNFEKMGCSFLEIVYQNILQTL